MRTKRLSSTVDPGPAIWFRLSCLRWSIVLSELVDHSAAVVRKPAKKIHVERQQFAEIQKLLEGGSIGRAICEISRKSFSAAT
jgi:hypothetical protein